MKTVHVKTIGIVNETFGAMQILHQITDNAGTHYVVTSSISNSFGTETFVFPADHGGRVTKWREQPGSLKNDIDHEKALSGYVRHLMTVE